MNTSTSNRIDQLLLDSGLFHSNNKAEKIAHVFDFSDEVILITGAAGSIGNELSKQLIASKYKKLILIDIAESPLYDLIKDLEFENVANVEFVVLNITDEKSLRHIFNTYKPTLIIHAAAYKHVPLMETNPYESIKINVLGTKLLADLSIEFEVKKFVFISTDKAVNPINIMGISKRIAENYLSYLSQKSNTLFLTTRFGNIVGSNGSIVPLLKKQIEHGKPLTITNKAISRYFICKYKACHLILKIATFNDVDSNIFTFNMGDSIKIIDLAERLLLFYQDSKKNIEIKITGLRPGEKLHEEIISNDEILIPTENQDILLIKEKNESEIKQMDFTALNNVNPCMPPNEIKSILTRFL